MICLVGNGQELHVGEEGGVIMEESHRPLS